MEHPTRDAVEHIYSDSSQSDDQKVIGNNSKNSLSAKHKDKNNEVMLTPSRVEVRPQESSKTLEDEEESEEEF